MSHNIEYYDYPASVDRKKVLAELSAHVSCCTRMEGGHGIDKIRWLDHVCDTYDEAMYYIPLMDSGHYDQLAVKYREPREPGKKELELQERIRKAYERLQKEKLTNRLEGLKSEYVGCKTCGSKLRREHMARKSGSRCNFCPVCGADLRSPTVLKSIGNAEKAYKQAQKAYEEEVKRAAKHRKAKLRWLVKIEYHT